MWTDIDYMDRRRVFTLDPERFPLGKMRELVSHLHRHHQHYIVMVDPAVSASGLYTYLFYLRLCLIWAYSTENGAFCRGKERNVFLYRDEDTLYQGISLDT